jgi:hypothetical protein
MVETISAYCSIFGFIISVVTLFFAFFIDKKIHSVEKDILFNTRVPALTNNLRQHHSQLSKDLGSSNERKIRETLSLCRTAIEDIYPKLPEHLSKEGITINKKLKKQYKSNFEFQTEKPANWQFWIKFTTINNLWESYDSLNSLITKIDNLKKDRKIIR